VQGFKKFTKGSMVYFYCGNTGTSGKSALDTHICSPQDHSTSEITYIYELFNDSAFITSGYYGLSYYDLDKIYMIAGAGGAAADSSAGGAGGGANAGDGTGGKGGNQSGRGNYVQNDFGSPITISGTPACGGKGYHAGESSTTGSAGGGSSYTGGISEYIDGVKYTIINESGVNDGTGKASIEFIKLA
jgi:hypothetical protein